MNYLAHLYLAGDQPLALVGALMGDFVKGPVDPQLLPALRAGIQLHRHIDSFTDAHPAFRRSRRRLPANLRRYGGIIVDIFYDHLLASDWSDYHHQPLEQFAQIAYRALDDHRALMPEHMRVRVRGLIRNDVLVAYQHLETIHIALQRTATRLRRPVDLGRASRSLATDRVGYQQDFDEFFPQLETYVKSQATSP